LPADKALDIARQLCAGLAAAHERGVIHRDLKPSNVMLDGRGKVRIADFGLAVVAQGTATPEDRAGTPAYMAPEQFAGAPLSSQSDIYALGLVLYEVFTGRQLLDARTLEELRSMQRDLERLRLTAADINLDPVVERVIMRCVDFDPSRRPASSLAVAAALPGGDPLAAALAAGETPSPQLVAAAGDATTIAPPIIVALMLVAVVGGLMSAASAAQRSAFTLLRPPYSGEVLGVKAGELLQRLRPDDPQVGQAAGFNVDSGWIARVVLRAHEVRTAWNALATARPAPVYYWQRTGPRPMAPLQMPGGTRVSEDDPPPVTPAMTLVRTDLQGRLAYLDARPSARDDQSTPAAVLPWPQLFREAGVDPARFVSAPPEWTPPSWGDARAAWTGTITEDPSIPLRVEAAAYRGRPTFFVIAAPWTVKPGDITASAVRAKGAGERAFSIGLLVLLAAAVLAAVFMARWSTKSGRADRRGAWRLAAFVGVSQLFASLLVMAHVADTRELLLLGVALTWPAFCAVAVWTLYLALEPYIRRAWPSALISWNRVLEGRFRDVHVARDWSAQRRRD
jgi:serine/threonine-protein kinase